MPRSRSLCILVLLVVFVSSLIAVPTRASQPGMVSANEETLLSENKPATSSTEICFEGEPPSVANDGDLTTYWCPSNLPFWWQVDLGDVYTLSRLTGTWGNYTDDWEYAYEILVSEDGETFTPIATNTTPTPTLDQDGFSAIAVSNDYFNVQARYLRIAVTQFSGPYYNHNIHEMQVYGSAAVESPVDVQITDSSGNEVSALTKDAEGWLSPNALKVTVRVTNTTNAGFQNAPLLVTLASEGNKSRFYVFGAPDTATVCSSGTSLYSPNNNFSYVGLTALCNLNLNAGQSETLQWDLWVQPSLASTLNIRAELRPATGEPLIADDQADLATPLAAIHPVLLIPGITATEPATTAGPDQADRLLAVADKALFGKGANYNAFYAALEKLGYEKNVTYFRFPWDWLTDVTHAARQMPDLVFEPSAKIAVNRPWVAAGTSRSYQSVKFDVVAHSGGNLVIRAYLEAPDSAGIYQGYVRRYVSVAGTHKGLIEGYSLLEGELTDRTVLNTIVTANAFMRAYDVGGYVTTVCNNNTVCRPEFTYEAAYAFAHDPFNGATLLPQVLPTGLSAAYLKHIQWQDDFPYGRIANPLLEPPGTVNSNETFPAGDPQDVLDPYLNQFVKTEVLDKRYPGRSYTTTYWGLNEPGMMANLQRRIGNNVCVIYAATPGTARVGVWVSDPRTQESAPHWLTGKQYNSFLSSFIYGPGDGLVPAESAEAADIWRGTERLAAINLAEGGAEVDHTAVVGYPSAHEYMTKCFLGLNEVPSFINESASQSSFGARLTTQELSTSSVTDRQLLIYSQGPVELTLTDPQGRRLGYDAGAASPLQEIPDGVYGTDPERGGKFFTVPAPLAGDYGLTITGTATGNSRLIGMYYDSTGVAPLFTAERQAVAGSQHTQLVDVPQQATDSRQPPRVSAGADQTAYVAQTVSFAGSFTDINPNDTHTFRWDFGDGTSTTGTLTPNHSYLQPGTYTATLSVTDNTGFTSRDSVEISVTPEISILSLVVPSAPVLAGSTIKTSAAFVDVSSSATHRAIWDWGDGGVTRGSISEQAGAGTVAGSHRYTSPGTYTVTLTVWNQSGVASRRSAQVIVTSSP